MNQWSMKPKNFWPNYTNSHTESGLTLLLFNFSLLSLTSGPHPFYSIQNRPLHSLSLNRGPHPYWKPYFPFSLSLTSLPHRLSPLFSFFFSRAITYSCRFAFKASRQDLAKVVDSFFGTRLLPDTPRCSVPLRVDATLSKIAYIYVPLPGWLFGSCLFCS